MSLTNPRDFEILISLIPKEYRKNVWFCPIRQNAKVVEVPSGTKIVGNEAYRLTPKEVRHRLGWGSNYGIYAIYGGLMFLDLDVEAGKLLASQGFLDALEAANKTLKIKSRNGGFQWYFLNDGRFSNQTLKEYLFEFVSIEDTQIKYSSLKSIRIESINFNKEKTKLLIKYASGLEGELLLESGKVYLGIGELRCSNWYVVGVGSFVQWDEHSIGQDGTYRIIQNEPITQFNPFGGYFKKNEEINKGENKIFYEKTEKKDKGISLIEYDEKLKLLGKERIKMIPAELRFLRCKYGKP